RREPHRRAHHHLLRDEVLIEAIRQRLLELLAERRVLHVGVEGDDTRVGLAEPGDRGAVRLARGHFLADRVRRWCDGPGLSARTRRGRRLWNPAGEIDVGARAADELALELGERAVELLALLERLAVPALLAFDERHPF